MHYLRIRILRKSNNSLATLTILKTVYKCTNEECSEYTVICIKSENCQYFHQIMYSNEPRQHWFIIKSYHHKFFEAKIPNVSSKNARKSVKITQKYSEINMNYFFMW